MTDKRRHFSRSAPKREAAEPMRLQRFLARSGIAARRKAEDLIRAGRVTVNGTVATIGQVVNPDSDSIAVDGDAVGAPQAAEWIVLHKPSGVLTTKTDPGGRPTVFDLVTGRPGLTYVGRLDYLTEGVLLLTTDGDAAHKLTHPSREIERTYLATVRGDAPGAARQALRGVRIEDGDVVAREARARPVGNGRWELELTIAEGRNREVRRLCEALGLEVLKLVRTQFGPVRLGALAPGATRPLTTKERDLIGALTR